MHTFSVDSLGISVPFDIPVSSFSSPRLLISISLFQVFSFFRFIHQDNLQPTLLSLQKISCAFGTLFLMLDIIKGSPRAV